MTEGILTKIDYLRVELKSMIVCLLFLHCRNKPDIALDARLWLLCTCPVQVVKYFYHEQEMAYFFPREFQTKKYCLHKSFLMLSCGWFFCY